jgi:uncharacterized delta-60 repeat protein
MRRQLRVIARTLLALAFVMAATACAAETKKGPLDRSFGGDGQVNLRADRHARMAVGRDGSIVVLSSSGRRIVRYLPDGRLDPGFGRNGRVTLPPEIAGSPYETADVAVDSQGRVLVFGSSFPPGKPTLSVGPYLTSIPITKAMVVRLRGDGSLDPNFGQGSAAISSDFGLRTEEVGFEGSEDLTTTGLRGTVDSQDRPLLLAGVEESYSPCLGHSGYRAIPRGIVRLTSSGVADPDFGGGNGVSPIPRNARALPPWGFAAGPADQVLMAGAESPCPPGTRVIGVDDSGRRLSGFEAAGGRRYQHMIFGAFAPSGGMVLRQGFPPTERVIRAIPTGSIDHNFGGRGFAVVRSPRGSNQTLRPAAVDSRGRIWMVGSYSRRVADSAQKRAFLFVERLLRSGEPDATFGKQGKVAVRIPAAEALGENQAVLDSRGRLVVLADVSRSTSSHVHAVAVRFK